MLTLLDGCTGLKTLLPQLEEIMFPLMQKLISSEVRYCFFEEKDARSIDQCLRVESLISIDRSIECPGSRAYNIVANQRIDRSTLD